MAKKENEYKEIFLAEAHENLEDLNRLFVELEKNPSGTRTVQEIFRIVHTLKGNALGLGFGDVAEISHVLEDTFADLRSGSLVLSQELMETLFKANDKLAQLIEAVESGKKVAYKGLRTKLKVLTRQLKESNTEEEPTDVPAAPEPVQASADTAASESNASDADEVPEEHVANEQDAAIRFSDSVSIPVRKLDALMNLVGELIIERDSLVAQSYSHGSSISQYARLQRITSDLQYGIMDVRLMQLGFMFKKFHRLVRDAASSEQKEVQLVLEGTAIEIDRNILKVITDSLVHLVRNAVGHGIENASDRRAAGKPEVGTVTLRGRNEKDMVLIDVIDDGKGIDANVIRSKAVQKGMISEQSAQLMSDEEVAMLIFEPGFSSAEKITAVSGRGVGMDVVKRATESIGGTVTVNSELGKGTTITLHLPSSMAVKGALLFRLEDQEFAVPLSYTEAVISLRKHNIRRISSGLMATYLDQTISVVFLRDLFNIENLNVHDRDSHLHATYDALDADAKLDILIVSYQNRYIGIVVDKLLQQQEIIEKTLVPPLDNLPLFSGATILGNGNVCLVLDIATIIKKLFNMQLAYA